jgi:hypothetical protein
MFLKTRRFKLLASLLVWLGSYSFAFAAWLPPQMFTSDFNGQFMGVASDANGNGMAIYTDGNVPGSLFASYFTGGQWGTPQLLDTDAFDIQRPAVAMDASGTALAIWGEDSTGNVVAAQFNGSSWGPKTILQNIGAGLFLSTLSIAMDGKGHGVALWRSMTDFMTVSFFSGGSWGPNTIISPVSSTSFDSVAYSANGSAVAGWIDVNTGNVIANNFVGGVWLGPVTLGTTNLLQPSPMEVGIDSNGHALALWTDGASGNVFSKSFNGASWQPLPTTVSTSPGNHPITSLAMSPSGTAVAACSDASDNGFSSVYNGTSWGTPLQFASGLITPAEVFSTGQVFSNLSVSVDGNGNAFAAWITNTLTNDPQVLSADLPAGGVWGNQELIYDSGVGTGNTPSAILTSFSKNGTRFVVFQVELFDSGPNIFGDASPSIIASGLKAKVCKNSFATQTERVKIISWTPSLDPTVVSYLLSRNGTLIATIPAAGPFIYKDQGRCKHADVYSLTTLLSTGVETSPMVITVK